MKKMKFRTMYTDRARKLIDKIEHWEGLETLDYVIENDAIGDTVIIVTGATEEVQRLKEIFNMVY